MGQKMHNAGTSQRVSSTGYVSTITYYKAQNCSSCPLRGQCHQSKDNRRIEVNHRLDALSHQAKTFLESEQGIIHRKTRCVEVESVFGQIKSNNKFNRFTFIGIDKAELEFTLMALGHNFRKMIAKGMPISKITAKIMPKNTQNGIGFTLIIEFYSLVVDQSRNRPALRNFQRLHKMIA
jgi:Transposase DDE domain